MMPTKRKAKRVQFACTGESMTKQCHKNECDINKIMLRATKSGFLESRQNGFYGDFTTATDFHTAQNKVIEANQMFNELPAYLRKKFDNDPGKLLEFVANEDNRQDAIKLGLIDVPPKPSKTAVTGSSEATEPVTPDGGSEASPPS
jgi:phage internal scaffolding protein